MNHSHAIQLRSGGHYQYGDCGATEISPIEDIACPLSRIGRFSSQTDRAEWAVGAHLVACEMMAEALAFGARTRYLALHHDDHEALTGDWPQPMKQYLRDNGAAALVDQLEWTAQASTAVAWDVNRHAWLDKDRPEPWVPGCMEQVKRIDLAMLVAERVTFLRPTGRLWAVDVGHGVTPEDAALAARCISQVRVYYGERGRHVELAYMNRHAALIREVKELEW